METSVTLFSKLFTGNATAYGTWAPNGKIRDDGKQEGGHWQKKGDVTLKLYADHLEGKQSIGIYPVKEGKCKFAVIDIDSYKQTIIAKALDLIKFLDLPFIAFESKSGGVHLYIFFDEFVHTSLVYPKIKGLANCLQAVHVDLRPSKICGIDDLDFFINLPLFGNKRKPLNISAIPGSDVYDSDMAINVLKQIKPRGINVLPDYLYIFYYYPCIARAIASKSIITGSRNQFLFNTATAIKSISEFEKKDKHDILYSINRLLPEPVDNQEIFGLAVRNFEIGAKTYNFMHQEFISYCVEKEPEPKHCLARTINRNTTGFVFGELKRVLTDPVHFIWTINDKEVKFKNSDYLSSPTKFRQVLMDNGMHLSKADCKQLDSLLEKAFTNAIVIDPRGEYLSYKSIFLSTLKSFLLKKASRKPGSLEINGAYANEKEGVFDIKIVELMEYMTSFHSRKTLSNLPPQEIYSIKKDLGFIKKDNGIESCPMDILFEDGKLKMEDLIRDYSGNDESVIETFNEESEEF